MNLNLLEIYIEIAIDFMSRTTITFNNDNKINCSRKLTKIRKLDFLDTFLCEI